MGGEPVASLHEVTHGISPIVFCLPDAPSVCSVFASIESRLSAERVLIDTTTVGPEDAITMAQRSQQLGVHWIEANVAGSSQQMQRGEATLLLAGEAAVVTAAARLFAPLSNHACYVGPAGNAARMKLVVNLAIGLHRAVLAESLALARAFDLDLAKALEVLRSCPSYSRAMDVKGDKMLQRDFTPEARVAQHLKDVHLMLAAGQASDQPLPLSTLHAQLLQSVVDRQLGHLDNRRDLVGVGLLIGPGSEFAVSALAAVFPARNRG